MNAAPTNTSNRTALAAMLLAALVAGCGDRHRASTPAGADVQVRTAPVGEEAVAEPIVASGLLAADEELPLSFKIGGVVSRVTVEEGRAVRAGDLLAVLESTEIDAGVAKARAASDKAERDFARARALFADSVVSRAQLEAAEAGRDVAAADLRAAGFNQRYAAIRAPQAGTVLRRMAEPGQLVGAGQPVLLFGGTRGGQVVRVGLADRDAARVQPGDSASVTFDTQAGRAIGGVVTRVGAAAAPGAGTIDVEIRLRESITLAGGVPASGLVGDVRIRPRRTESVRVVPIAALLEGDGDRGVIWSVGADGRAVRHDVRLAFFDAARAGVRSGLEDVDRVVTDGAAYLTESSTVRVTGEPVRESGR